MNMTVVSKDKETTRHDTRHDTTRRTEEPVFSLWQVSPNATFTAYGINGTDGMAWRDTSSSILGGYSMIYDPTVENDWDKCSTSIYASYVSYSAFNLSAGDFSSQEGETLVVPSEEYGYFQFQSRYAPFSQTVNASNAGLPISIDISASGGKFLVEASVESFRTELAPADLALSSSTHYCFQDRRCPGKEGERMVLYNAHHQNNTSLFNQNAANAPGEILYIYEGLAVSGKSSDTFQITRYDGVIMDTRYRKYEFCNPLNYEQSERSKKWVCERSDYWSHLGVGHASLRKEGHDWNVIDTCETLEGGMDWVSLNENGHNRTWDASFSQNTTVNLTCVLEYLTPVFPWRNGTSWTPPLELYPQLEAALQEAFDKCPHEMEKKENEELSLVLPILAAVLVVLAATAAGGLVYFCKRKQVKKEYTLIGEQGDENPNMLWEQ
jgi:hypothetical protein